MPSPPRPIAAPAFHALAGPGRDDFASAAPDRLHLHVATGRGAQLDAPAGWMSVWLPLRGDLLVTAAEPARPDPMAVPGAPWSLARGQILVARGTAIHARASTAHTAWLCLAGTPSAWTAALRSLPGMPAAHEVFARQFTCPRELRRALVHLARCARRDDRRTHNALRALLQALIEAQRELAPLVERCNGRTLQRRRLTLQRLLRTHQLIERDPEARLDLAQLARSANYSPWHLIRMYRDVFGETPSEHAARLRLERAWTLVRDSAMPVCLITQHLGYESQSAFCRAFKNAFGLTTTQARHLSGAVARQARVRIKGHARVRNRPPAASGVKAVN